MRKIFFCVLFTLTFVFCSGFLSYAEYGRDYKYVYDKAEMLTEEEERALNEKLKLASAQCGCEIYFVVSEYWQNFGGYEGWYFDELGLDASQDLMVLDVQHDKSGEYYYYLDTYGDVYSKISDREVNRLLDDKEVYNNIKSGNLIHGANRFVILAEDAVNGNLPAPWLKIILISSLIGFIPAAVAVAIVVYRYKKKLKSEIYPLSKYARLSIDQSRTSDVFLNSYITKVRIQSSSSSRGRSGGGGRRSGGGGRRGGR